jgi:hypothetical protein
LLLPSRRISRHIFVSWVISRCCGSASGSDDGFGADDESEEDDGSEPGDGSEADDGFVVGSESGRRLLSSSFSDCSRGSSPRPGARCLEVLWRDRSCPLFSLPACSPIVWLREDSSRG